MACLYEFEQLVKLVVPIGKSLDECSLNLPLFDRATDPGIRLRFTNDAINQLRRIVFRVEKLNERTLSAVIGPVGVFGARSGSLTELLSVFDELVQVGL